MAVLVTQSFRSTWTQQEVHLLMYIYHVSYAISIELSEPYKDNKPEQPLTAEMERGYQNQLYSWDIQTMNA